VQYLRYLGLKLSHTQLLEGIGALSKADSKKATSRSGNYQDSAIAPLGCEHDNEAVLQEDDDNNESTMSDTPIVILSAIAKVISKSLPICKRSSQLV
jgi:hypothetical protein